MTRKYLLLCCFITLFSFLASANTGEENAKKSDVMGGVFTYDTKKPLSQVSITAYSNSKKEKVIVTDAQGHFSFDDLKPGNYKFVFEKDGYKKVTKEKVLVQPDTGAQLNVEMSARPSFEFMPGPLHFSDFE